MAVTAQDGCGQVKLEAYTLQWALGGPLVQLYPPMVLWKS